MPPATTGFNQKTLGARACVVVDGNDLSIPKYDNFLGLFGEF